MNIAIAQANTVEHSLRVERVIAAPPERVFAYWTEPERIAKWLAPGEMRVIDNDVDLQPGGAWFITMRYADGRITKVGGIYLAIEPPHRLSFTWGGGDANCARGPETMVEIALTVVPGGTRLVLTHSEFESSEQRDRHEQGWSMCFDKLEHVARG